MLSCDFLPQILDVRTPGAFCFFRHAVRRHYVEQGRPSLEGVALVGHKLAKIKLRVQRRIRPKKPISASI
jgi:hypothetical protein